MASFLRNPGFSPALRLLSLLGWALGPALAAPGEWTPPPGDWTILGFTAKARLQKVKRAAPGGAGEVLDPYAPHAMTRYLAAFDRAFAGFSVPLPRAQFHDLFEFDHYAVSEIPETEILRQVAEDQIPMLRFAASAAHANGTTLVSSESFTWSGGIVRPAPAGRHGSRRPAGSLEMRPHTTPATHHLTDP